MNICIKYWVIINPISGIGKKGEIPILLEKHLKKEEYSIKYTKYKRHAVEIAKEAKQAEVPVLIVVGGDGSVHEVASQLINSKTKLGIIPAGSGNGVARWLKLPLKKEEALLHIINGSPKKIDSFSVNQEFCLGVGGLGFDALVAHKFDEYHSRGFWSYIKITIGAFFNYKPLQLTINNKTYRDIFLCSIANSNQFGNNAIINPKAEYNSGKIEICIIKKVNLFQAISLAYQLFKGNLNKNPNYKVLSTKSCIIESDSNLVHLDGEPYKICTKLSVKTLPSSIETF